MNLKPSIYNYYFDIDDNEIGIFNSLSKALVALERNEYSSLLHDISALPADIIAKLEKSNILVPSTVNEHESVNILRTNGILNASESVYRIFSTTDCNARCFYCYEKDIVHSYMSNTTADDIAQFIIEHVGNRSCLIQWFGGEPLMNTEAIDIVTSKLRAALGDRRVRFMMITNGSLVSEEIIRKMIDFWKISRVQISLDGAHEEYVHRKNYVSIEDPFTVILENIRLLLEKKIFVSLRINYDMKNYKSIIELLDILAQNFKHFQNLHVYAYHIFTTEPTETADPLFKEEWFAMQRALIESGFLRPLDAYSLSIRKKQCFACSSNSFVIMPDGSLYKCALATKDTAACVGNIKTGITNYPVFERWCNTSLREECTECPFLPLCQGGCRAGDLGYISEHCFAQKEFAADVLRERIKYLNIQKGWKH